MSLQKSSRVKNRPNQVRSTENMIGKYYVLWRSETVLENGRKKEFAREADAWNFLAQCDEAGRLVSQS